MGITHLHLYGDFLIKIKQVKYKTNGVSLQHTVSLITQTFLNKNIVLLLLLLLLFILFFNSETMAHIPSLLLNLLIPIPKNILGILNLGLYYFVKFLLLKVLLRNYKHI